MSDYLNNISGDSDLDAILAEVKKSKTEEAVSLTDEPSKTWSLDDIDRLIANSNGEEYVPKPKKELTPAEDFERILSREFDTGMFTLKPLTEKKPEKEEMQDISSMSADFEVDGQEKFYEKEEIIDDFDSELFELETVIVPEDIPAPPPPMIAWQQTEPAEEKADDEAPEEIKDFFGEEKEEHITENDYKTRFFTKVGYRPVGNSKLGCDEV